jgi:hypothetical protein
LVSEEAIMAIAQKDPGLIYQENAQGMTPFALIEPMIKHLEYVRKDDYVKCAESGWAGSNIRSLTKLKRELCRLAPTQGEKADAAEQDEEAESECGVLWWN